MKRSEINYLLQNSIAFFNQMNFWLPSWAYWKPEDWKGSYDTCCEIVDNMLGWDLTDFGSNDFNRQGLILFTIRNGNLRKDKKPYAEKIMIVEEMQETPMHFHWSKMEDIINRGGGNLVLQIFGSDEKENISDKAVSLRVDGKLRSVPPGGNVILMPGESICLKQRVYHRFFGEKGKGRVLVGEVSTVNDDSSDNRFYNPVGRFPDIEEDKNPLHLLASDYFKYL